MRTRPPQLIGINVNELARLCHVSLKTAARWKAGTTCPPKSALMLLSGDLGYFDPAWKGWCVRKKTLVSPEGWEITLGDVISSPLLRQQLAAFKSELRRMKELDQADTSRDQPLPADFPDWVFEMRA